MGILKDEFIKDYENLTYEELAEKYHISRSSVRNLVTELGLSKPRGRKKKITVDKEKL